MIEQQLASTTKEPVQRVLFILGVMVYDIGNMARPTEYKDETFNKICSQLADGMSLKRICQADDMPSKATFYNWLNNSKDLLDKYARAKDDSADALAEDIQDIADKVLIGGYEANNARVAIDAKKWIASKLKPKKYGDRIDMTTNGKDLPTPLLGGLSLKDTTIDIIE